jgi:Fe-S cluster assembly protein SufD
MKIRVKQGERMRGVGAGVFELEANSHLDLTQVTFAENNMAQQFEIIFLGEGASCNLLFLDLSKNSSHLETTVKVNHQVPNCKSVLLHKGLYHDESEGTFKAMVEVAKDALGSDAFQLHRSLLLSPSARVHAQPHLQIQTDAVKCKHGVSIGQLDDKALFYLKARGLDEQTAKRFLIQGFAKEIIDSIPDEKSRVTLEEQVFTWI